jgi:lipid-A-disaccharide synthase
MGGAELARAGVRLDVDIGRTTAMGGLELVRRLPAQVAAFARLLELARRWKPAAALLVDAPDFNLRLGARLRRLGVPVLGMVAPQFWAWRRGRLDALSSCLDRLACILPFEEAPLRRHGVDATFVGHPAAEAPPLARPRARAALGLGHEERCLALLPGSRPGEVSRLLGPVLGAAARLRVARPGLQVLLAAAPTVEVPRELPPWVRVVTGSEATPEGAAGPGRLALAAADAAAVASGTATIEAALQGTPQVALYRMAWPTWAAAHVLVRTRFAALPNILANRRLVPELLQGDACVDRLAAALGELLDGGEAARAQRDASAWLGDVLRGPGASRTTAAMLAGMLRR